MKAFIKLRGIELGKGRPKIAVPIVGKNAKDILEMAAKVKKINPDIIEWRIDFFDRVMDMQLLKTLGQQLRIAIGDVALLTTFRTKSEGGEKIASDEEYFEICRNILEAGFTDALDIERYHDVKNVKEITREAHDKGIVTIMSNHNFSETPTVAEIVKKLTNMVDDGADVAKMAVMPNSVEDVLTLLNATNIANQSLSQPIITMSMGNLGKISRISGEIFGSCVTFATVGAASAPGQIALENMKLSLEDLKLD